MLSLLRSSQQPQQLAAPLEPGEGGKELIRERERERGGEELAGSHSAVSRGAAVWSVSGAGRHFGREPMNLRMNSLPLP